jgi:hypothetical protein
MKKESMAIYKIYLRSFAPWKDFGIFTKQRSIHIPVPMPGPWAMTPMPVPSTIPIKFGGGYHGDGRGFSVETGNSAITARVSAFIEVNLPSGMAGNRRVWCDESRGPLMGFGPEDAAVGVPTSTVTAMKKGAGLAVVMAYGAANPLFKGAPDIDAKGEYALMPGVGTLQIDAVITGDQFPACESFIEDPSGKKIFVGGFAPDNKEQIMRLYGGMNRPKKIWFQSHLVISLDAAGNFVKVEGGGSGSNATAPQCKGMAMSVLQWNSHIMNSIPMPRDAGL